MMLLNILVLAFLTFAFSATSSELELGEASCAPAQPRTRNNPRPLDCIYAITYILSIVTDRSQIKQFSTNPAPGQTKLPLGHSIGTCVVYALPYQSTSAAPVTSSMDEIVRTLLFVVGTCLMNNKPETVNWGGKAAAGLHNGLWIVVQGTRKDGASAVPTGNRTLEVADIRPWFERPISS